MQVPSLAQQLRCRPALNLNPVVGKRRANRGCQLRSPGFVRHVHILRTQLED